MGSPGGLGVVAGHLCAGAEQEFPYHARMHPDPILSVYCATAGTATGSVVVTRVRRPPCNAREPAPAPRSGAGPLPI